MGFKTAAQMHGCASPNALRNLGVLWGFIVLSTGLVYFGGNGGNGPRPRRCVCVCVFVCARRVERHAPLSGGRCDACAGATTVDGPTQGTVERASSKGMQRG
jgi:hypothetical protein